MNTSTMTNREISLGGAFRLPEAKPISGKITLGGAFRLPAVPATVKVALGGAFRLPVAR